jgi:hypothetical protein
MPSVTSLIVSLVGSTSVDDHIYQPGHVYQDRRDELRGGRRNVLRGLKPRATVVPRSRVNSVPPAAGLSTSLTDAPVTAFPRRQRLPSAVVVCRARYRSFDEDTGTYRTYAGARRTCPFLM